MPFVNIPAIPQAGDRVQAPMRVFVGDLTSEQRAAARAADQISESDLRRELHLTDDADWHYAQQTPQFPRPIGQRTRAGGVLHMLLKPSDHLRTENIFEKSRITEWRAALLTFVGKLR